MNISNINTPGKTGGNGSSSNTLLWLVVSGLAIIAGGFLLATLTPLILPLPASAEARQVDDLFRFMLTIGGAIFLLVQGVLAYSVIRYRAKPGDMSDGPAIHGNSTLEFIWTVIPAIIVIAITIYSYQVWVDTRSVKPNERVTGAVGARFAWTFNYFVPLEEFPASIDQSQIEPELMAQIESEGGISLTHPQLHTFVNQPLKMEMNTQDVNHAFWIPAMRVKQDLLAGRETELRFTPVEAGAFPIVCAELCGSGHGNMAGFVGPNNDLQGAWLIVHPDEETYLREFVEPELRTVVFPPDDPVLLGRQILASGAYPCATCHVLDDLGWQGNIGPNLNGIGARTQRLAATGQPAMEAYLAHSIRYPGEYLVPGFGNLMPAFNPEPDQPNYMPEDDLNAIVAYLLTQTD